MKELIPRICRLPIKKKKRFYKHKYWLLHKCNSDSDDKLFMKQFYDGLPEVYLPKPTIKP